MFKPFIKPLDGDSLKPCPHCGGKAHLDDTAEFGLDNPLRLPSVAVRCTQCHAYGRTICYEWTEHYFFGYEMIRLTRLEARTIAAVMWNIRSPREYRQALDDIADMLHRNRCFDVPENQTDTLDNDGLTHARRGKKGEHGNEYQRADRPEQRRDSECMT